MPKPLPQSKRPSKFFNEDIVCRIEDPQETYVVLRCWHDSEDLPIPPHAQANDPLLRPLEKGEVGISSLITGVRRIVSEVDYDLVDRTFQPGDVCKRSFDDVASGVVIETHVQVKLEHAISGAPTSGWVKYEELDSAVDFFIGDHVVCDDWVGQIEESFDEITGQLVGGELFRIAEIGSRFRVGDRGLDALASSAFPNLFSCLTSTPEVIVQVKPFVLAINWLAINQSLDKHESEHRKRPQRFWSGPDISRLTIIRPRPEVMARIGERVVFKNASVAEMHGIKFTHHGKDDNVIEVDTMVVRETRSEVTVLWQDGTKETLLSTTLIPYLNVDEYDCWPGDYVLWKGEDEKRVAVIQSVFSARRTASVMWYPPSTSTQPPIAVVSSLELDPHGGSSDPNPSSSHELFGVRRGDFVFIHNDSNGVELPKVPSIGEVESWIRDQDASWRAEMVNVGVSILEAPGKSARPVEYKVRKVGDPSIKWFGEVTDLHLNGDIEVTVPCGDIELVPLSRLTLLDGSFNDMIDMWGDGYSDDGMDQEPGEVSEQVVYEDGWLSERDGQGDEDEGQSEGSWETFDDGKDPFDHMDVEEDVIDADGDVAMMSMETLSPTTPKGNVPRPVFPILPSHSLPSPPESASSPPPPFNLPSDAAGPSTTASTTSSIGADEDSPWERFSILSSAPLDHAFYSSKPSTTRPSKAFNSRLSKEYRVLASSLPETILVRAYEDRTDLLRCLIIGPENTPYEDAPFVIDWFLDGTFPQTPPVAHFHSWTNGNGRVNPNLYEEGKVCLSILGTWTGDKSESWSASRSSLLQAFVSIQGLVLVREPWFCEPAFDKLRGTEEGSVNSRLYSEKAYVLSRGFVRRALEYPPGGLEAEIEWLYYARGKLDKVLRDANRLIEKSESGDGGQEEYSDGDRAVEKLTAGAVLPLQRTLAKLQFMLDSRLASGTL